MRQIKKISLLTLAVALFSIGGTLMFSGIKARAANEPFILAQNDDRPGFFQRLFNRNDDGSGQQGNKPVYVNPGQQGSSNRSNVYQNYSRRGATGNRTQKFEEWGTEQAEARAAERRRVIQKQLDKEMEVAMRRLEAREEADARKQAQQASSRSSRTSAPQSTRSQSPQPQSSGSERPQTRVYSPQNRDSSGPARIFNVPD